MKSSFWRFSLATVCFVFITSLFILSGCEGLTGANKKEADEELTIFGNINEYNPLIEEAQNNLKKAGFDLAVVDGKMSRQMRKLVKSFQKANELKATGYIDTFTWEKLNSYKDLTLEQPGVSTQNIAAGTQGATQAGVTAEMTPAEIPPMDFKSKTPEQIKMIQQALLNAGLDAGSIDGKMGPKTKKAIEEFQKSKGLNADGKVGPKTWAELSKYLNKE